MNDRPIFVLVLRADKGVDGLRAIRALMKIALCRFGLRVVTMKEQPNPMDAGALLNCAPQKG